MIEYIIFEEDNKYLEIIKETINNKMIKYDIEYTIKEFNNIDEIKKYKSSNYKIYILDYKTIKESGLEIVEYIREKLNDWQSILLLQTSYKELKSTLIDKKLYILDLMIKDKIYIDTLNKNIEICINIYDNIPKSLKYTYKKIIYNIKLKDIVCIEKDYDNKRCIIKTNNNDFYIQGSLSNVEKLLDKRFIKCSRSYIININEVLYYNIKDNLIRLNNDFLIEEISRNKKKEIIERLTNKN